ncbi:MAG TPA: family 16 glycosylhydrolase [Magnetospirillum sp.]|nr:family 16 glycosylhydrolase [Magnetospirillum sp.]
MPALPQPPAAVTAAAGSPTWSLTLNQTFDSGALDDQVWSSWYRWGDQSGGSTNYGNNEQQWYMPSQVTVSGGTLNLTATQQTHQGWDEADQPQTFPYTSGMVSSAGKFDFQYGYFEASMDIPVGKGLWPAFWTMSEAYRWPPEIDVMEILGDQPDDVVTTYHYQPPGGSLQSTGSDTVIAGLRDGFHTYGVLWEPDRLVWFVDGVQVFTTDQAPTEAMYLICNLAVGGDWPGLPDADTQFPATVKVDHVQVWQAVVDRTLAGTSADDCLSGGPGRDTVAGGNGADTLWGNGGNDTLIGGGGDDRLEGGRGLDTASYSRTAAALSINLGTTRAQNTGGAGTDTLIGVENLVGGSGGDRLTGSAAANVLNGGAGNDILTGGAGADWLVGGDGADRLRGDGGGDTLTGGLGADIFAYYSRTDGRDTITDFSSAQGDRIAFHSANFGNLPTGRVLAGRFAANGTGSAADGATRFVFNTTTGVLSYDADGTGSAVAVAVATLNVHTLSAANLVIVPS